MVLSFGYGTITSIMVKTLGSVTDDDWSTKSESERVSITQLCASFSAWYQRPVDEGTEFTIVRFFYRR